MKLLKLTRYATRHYRALVDCGYKGIIISSGGSGHVNKPVYPALKRTIVKGVNVFMTVQTLWGYTHMFVYDTGRDLLTMGICFLKLPTLNWDGP